MVTFGRNTHCVVQTCIVHLIRYSMQFASWKRRIIYTTNVVESLHSQVRKAIRNKGRFPSDESATKLIYLALRNIAAKWKRPPKEWHAAKVQLAIQFPDRFTVAA